MFAFRSYGQIQGRLSKIDVPFSEIASTFVEQGAEDSLTGAAWRLGQDIAEWWSTPIIEPKLANKLYGIEGELSFDEPIRDGIARLRHERKTREMQRESFLSAVRMNAGKYVGGFVAGMMGNMLMPGDLGFMAVPLVGSEAVASDLAKSGAAAWRVAIRRGLITTEENLIRRGWPAPRIMASTLEGLAGASITEIPVGIQKWRDQAHYGPRDVAFNVVAGGVFGAVIRIGVEAWARRMGLAKTLFLSLRGETQRAALSKASEDIEFGRPIKVDDYIALDENVIRERAKLTATEEAAARAESLRTADMPELEILARAQIETEGSLGSASDATLVKIAREQVLNAENTGQHTVATRALKKLLAEYDAGDRGLVLIKNIAGQLDLIYDNLADAFPPYYAAGGVAGVGERASGPNSTRYRQAMDIAQEIHSLESDIKAKEIVAQRAKNQGKPGKARATLEDAQRLLKKKQDMIEGLRKQLVDEGVRPPLTNEERIRLGEESELRLRKAIDTERAKRIEQYVDKKRLDKEKQARADYIAEEQARGKLLPAEEIDRLKTKSSLDESDLALAQRELDNLKKIVEQREAAGAVEGERIGFTEERMRQLEELYAIDKDGNRIKDPDESSAVDAAVNCLRAKSKTL